MVDDRFPYDFSKLFYSAFIPEQEADVLFKCSNADLVCLSMLKKASW